MHSALAYLRERFPLSQYLPLGLLFGAATIAATARTQEIPAALQRTPLIAAALLLFLFRLRVFDEFKDAAHDRAHHPDRPVPRGLIRLPSLAIAAACTTLLEFLIAFLSGTDAQILFAVSALYSLLLANEFFAREWLRSRFTVYIAVHEALIIPLVLYLAALAGARMDAYHLASAAILVLSLGAPLFALEIARKMRAPAEERSGNDTYSAQYGPSGAAVLLFVVAAAGSVASAVLLADVVVATLQAGLLGVLAALCARYVRTQDVRAARHLRSGATVVVVGQLLLLIATVL